MANGNNATIGFEKQIWDAACVLWGHIPAAEYRKVIVGLIFLRYISNAFEKRHQELVAEGDGFEDDRDAYAEDNISSYRRMHGGARLLLLLTPLKLAHSSTMQCGLLKQRTKA